MLSRRRFLTMAGVTGSAAAAGLVGWRSLGEDGPSSSPSSTLERIAPPVTDPGRVLVVVQLGGGNDALNTLVPVEAGVYHDARPTLGVAPEQAVALAGAPAYGLAPALAPLAPLWADGRLAAVASVGFPDQSRSHFQAMDTWWSATPGTARTTGWLGRWLDAVATGDPGGRVGELVAVALGSGAPAMVGDRVLPTVVTDPTLFGVAVPAGLDAEQVRGALHALAEPGADQPLLAAAQQAVPAALAAADRLAPAGIGDQAEAARDRVTATTLLDVAAGVVALDLGVRVLTVSLGGFDTHAGQADAHQALWEDLAAGLVSFQDRIDRAGLAERVTLVTTSEFGRRVAENGGGTDHGKAGTSFVLGAPVQGGQVIGGYDLAALDNGDLPVAHDTRSLYATCLDWLGGPTDEVLQGSFPRLPLLPT